MRRGFSILAVMALLSLLVTACQTSASGSPAASAAAGGASAAPGESIVAGGGTTVNVTLQEWSVLPDAESATAGDVTFVVTNEGPDEVHEFVIIRTDLDPGDLPTDADGAVDETGAGLEVIDEIEDIPVGDTAEVTVTLEAGSYVLVCNIFEPDMGHVHYALGMRTAFTVQ